MNDFTYIMKPVGGFCNLSCSYCYFKQNKSRQCKDSLMSDEILRLTIDEACKDSNKIEFIWHGGEPLLAGLAFYQKVVFYQGAWKNRKQIEIINSIQTNGILLDDQWIDFLFQNHFNVGISIDGPEDIHNLYRRYPDGEGSFREVINSYHLLKRNGINPGVICCISNVSWNKAEELLKFCVDESTQNIKFIPVQGRDIQGNLLSYSVNPRDYADFFIKLLNKWLELDNPNIEIREIKSIINIMMGGDMRECCFAGECYRYLAIYPDGSVYSCDSLPQIKNYYFGNIQNGLDSIKHSLAFIRMRNRITELQGKCNHCEWFNVCKGGCLQDYYPDIWLDNTKNEFCGDLQRIFKTVKTILKQYKLI